MGNFYTDNDDIRFLFRHIDLGQLARTFEEGFRFVGEFDYAPADEQEAIRNYEMVLEALGELCADFIAPRAESVDRTGNTLHEDGTVARPAGIAEAIEKLGQAEVMGFTLPHRFGGLNFPNLVYSMANEILSRADAALMNIFGLQGIADTINAFASEEIKQQYLPAFSNGKVTGAMVLTEPDAGSDLQAVKLRAFQDSEGRWFLHGVKRFITNGCGDVLLVLARSEPDRSGGLGLSLLLCEPGPTVHIRRLEDKLGIHGSPTCEIFFDNTPCVLIGERQRGLVPYVATLMNGARIGIAAQSMGIAEAAYRIARDYAASRKQFSVAIEKLPAVRDMLIDMKLALEAGRALLYDTSRVVDLAIGYNNQVENPWRAGHAAALRAEAALVSGMGFQPMNHRQDADATKSRGQDARDTQRVPNGEFRVGEPQDALATSPPQDKEELKRLKDKARIYKRYAGMLTPMSKYYCSEMCNRVAYDSIQVLGGSGYMRDYACERHARDARITTIYEGTSQLQIVAAVRGVCSGTAEKYLAELAALEYDPQVSDLLAKLVEGTQQLLAAIEFAKAQGNDYMDLYGRALVDVAIDLINGYLLCGQASTKVEMNVPVAGGEARNGARAEGVPPSDRGQDARDTRARNGQTIPMKQRKALLARRYVEKNAPKIRALTELVRQGDQSTFRAYEALVGPVPES